MTTLELRVDGMKCGGCEATVRDAVAATGTFASVEADHTTGTVRVTGDVIDGSAVRSAIVGAGFTVA